MQLLDAKITPHNLYGDCFIADLGRGETLLVSADDLDMIVSDFGGSVRLFDAFMREAFAEAFRALSDEEMQVMFEYYENE